MSRWLCGTPADIRMYNFKHLKRYFLTTTIKTM
jgi:hypothetical protein